MVVADVVQAIGGAAGGGIRLLASPVRIGFGHLIQYPDHALDDVVDVGEVALHVPIVEDIDRASFDGRLREEEERHVGPSPGAVDREEAQPGGRDAEQVAVGVRHQFVGLLAGGVEADGVVDRVVHRERDLGVGTVHAGRAGVDEVLDLVVTAAFEQVGEADQVGLHIRVRILQRVAHAGLRGEMDDAVEGVFLKDFLDGFAVFKVFFKEYEPGKFFQQRQNTFGISRCALPPQASRS